MFAVAKLNDVFRRLLSKATAAVQTVQGLVALAQAAAAEATAAAEVAQNVVPIDAIVQDEETGAVQILAMPGMYQVISQQLAAQGLSITEFVARMTAAEGELALKASRAFFDETNAVATLREPVAMDALERATALATGDTLTLPLSEPLGEAMAAGTGLAVETPAGPLRVHLAEEASGAAVDVEVDPVVIDAPAGARVYLTAREVRNEILSKLGLLEVNIGSDVISGTPLVGVLAQDVAAGNVTQLPLKSCTFGVLKGETVKVQTSEGPISVTVDADLALSSAPVTLVVELVAVPDLAEDAEVRLTDQTLGSIVRRTALGTTSLISAAELDEGVVLCTLSEDVEGTSVEALPVTAVVREEGTLKAPSILVIRDGDLLTEVIVSEDVAVDDAEIAIYAASVTASAGAEVVEPGRARFNLVLEAAGEFTRVIGEQIASGEGLVTYSEFSQTVDAITAQVVAGDVRSVFDLTPETATLKAGLDLVLDAARRIRIGQGSIYTGSGFFNFSGGTANVGITSQSGVQILPFLDLLLGSDDGAVVIQGTGGGLVVATNARFDEDVNFYGSRPRHSGVELATVNQLPPGGPTASYGINTDQGFAYFNITNGQITSVDLIS